MPNKKEIINLFEAPGAEYRGKPFWSWNGELKKEELLRQLHIIKDMGLGGFFMHSRAGLITEYLGEEWFELVNAVADEGEKLGLEAWLYDEDRWPSGSAGGKVTIDPQYTMKSLVMFGYDSGTFDWQNEITNKADHEIVAVFAADIDNINLYGYTLCQDESDLKNTLKNSKFNKVIVFRIILDAPGSVYNGTTYIDTMSYKAVERFIELTHEEYKKHCGSRIGTSIKGIFTDEPHRGHMLDDFRIQDGVMICSAAYTDDIFSEFEKRYGYALKPVLPELFFRKDGRKVSKIKLNFVDLGNNLFIERFAMPIKEWCDKNNMVFTGHVLHEDSFANQTVPNGSVMRFYQHMTYPGVDLLTENNRCYWVAKQISSAARQTGQKWLMSELYGATGWQFDFKAHKAVGDWQALFGINLRCHHLSWYTMEGESKRDYPGSILHQSPYYKDYGYVESYFARFGVVMTQGNPVCDVLVLNAIESAWAMMYAGWANWLYPAGDNRDEISLEDHYTKLFHYLTENQIDFDYGEEYMMNEMYRVDRSANGRAVLHIGKASYHTVVVSGLVTMRPSTVKILKEFLEAGGKVIFSGEIPSYVDAVDSDEPKILSEHHNSEVVAFEEKALVNAVRTASAYYAQSSGGGKIFLQTRYDAQNELLYTALINTDRENAIHDVKLSFYDQDGVYGWTEDSVHAESWDLASGRRFEQEITFENGVPVITFDIEAAGDKVFVLSKETDCSLEKPETAVLTKAFSFAADTEFEYDLDEMNVCVLDYAKWKFGDGDWQAEEEVLKVDAKVRDAAGIEHRSGGMLQPWYAKKYCNDAYGEIEMEYEFYADILPEGEVFLCGERPEFCQFYLNDTKLECKNPDDFWIDTCFRKMEIPAGLIQKGRNTVTYKTLFRRTTNIESVYLIGDFGVRLDGRRKTIDRRAEKIGFKNLCEYNMPFYTGCVTYKIPNPWIAVPEDANKILLKIDGYRGSLVKVAPIGAKQSCREEIAAWDPYEADITEWVKAGFDIGVTLVCSRRNVFGPLHLIPAEHGLYGPDHFTLSGEHWSDEYAFINSSIYGISIKAFK